MAAGWSFCTQSMKPDKAAPADGPPLEPHSIIWFTREQKQAAALTALVKSSFIKSIFRSCPSMQSGSARPATLHTSHKSLNNLNDWLLKSFYGTECGKHATEGPGLTWMTVIKRIRVCFVILSHLFLNQLRYSAENTLMRQGFYSRWTHTLRQTERL